jgi:hypothetical protein
MEYELTLSSKRTKDFGVDTFDKIQADNLVSLLTQFVLLIASLHRRELEELGRRNEDDDYDLPF